MQLIVAVYTEDAKSYVLRMVVDAVIECRELGPAS
jgi:hypothetical protein